jgi:arabinogalactan endo-1,4-beta-galactosidase
VKRLVIGGLAAGGIAASVIALAAPANAYAGNETAYINAIYALGTFHIDGVPGTLASGYEDCAYMAAGQSDMTVATNLYYASTAGAASDGIGVGLTWENAWAEVSYARTYLCPNA